jgi:hypothetical protein
MLKYNQNVSSCASIASQNGVYFDTKNKLKGAASLLRPSSKSYNNVNDLNACVIPYEVSGILNTADCAVVSYSYENGQVNNMFNLPKTTDGNLSLDADVASKQLLNGEAIYPTNGCFYNIPGNDTNKFVDTVGQILDYDNQLILQPLRIKLQKLKDDCAELDRQIAAMKLEIAKNQKILDDLNYKCNWWGEQKIVLKDKIAREILKREEEARKKAEEEARLLAEYAAAAASGADIPPELAAKIAGMNMTASGISGDTVIILFKGLNFSGFNVGLGMGNFDLCALENNGIRFGELMSFRFVKPGQVTVFENENHTGRSQIFYSNVPNLSSLNFKIASIIVTVNRGPPPPIPPVVTIYSECGYPENKGWKITLKPGRYNIQQLKSLNGSFKNDTMSAIKFLRPGKAILYKDDNFRGSTFSIAESAACLKDKAYKFSDKMSSIEVIEDPNPPAPPEPPVVIIYDQANFNDKKGWNITLRPGRYTSQQLRNINMGFKNDTTTSVKFLRPGKVVLFKDDNFRGQTLDTKTDIGFLGDFGFNDKMTSIEVIGDPIPPPKVCRR